LHLICRLWLDIRWGCIIYNNPCPKPILFALRAKGPLFARWQKAGAFQAWVKAAYLLHGISFISSASPCLQAWVVDVIMKNRNAGRGTAATGGGILHEVQNPTCME